MPKKKSEANRLCLAGDWSIRGVAEQLPLLVQYLANLSDPQSPEKSKTCAANGIPEVDLAGITALDACGCQLLANFSRALQQPGISPRIRNIPDPFISKIRLLGFDRELNLSL